MLDLRVIVPADMRDDVVAVLRRQVGVAHILIHPGAAVEPSGGDEITAVIARECANDVIKALKDLDAQHRGAILLTVLDTVLSTRAHEAEDDAEGDPADAVVWDELIARTREESTLSVTFVLFLTLACLLAAVGAVTDSMVTVVGAMVLGPEFGPLAAVSVAIVQRRPDLARRAAIALLVGFPIAMGVTALLTMAAHAVGWVDLDSMRDLDNVDFIFQVGPISFVVALLAGAAGMLSLVSAKSAALVGVFISVTTVPAAGFTAVAGVLGDWGMAARSATQLAVNLIGIVIACVTMLVLRPRANLIPRRAQT
ncbi:membrane protein [Mycobacterium sp. SWH-M1]|nr:membrane protein [Mycobacterium sp. SWH-M1]